MVTIRWLANAAKHDAHAPGFTLIEMLVVLAIVALLLTLAVPRYFGSIDVAKETILVENLRTTRDAIDRFYTDTGRYPESLQELVARKYVRTLPYDPIVEDDSKWSVVPPVGEVKGNVYDIRSTAQGVARNGKAFAAL